MMIDIVKREVCALRKTSKNAYVASVNEEGYPQIKAMFVLETAGIQTHFFSTNLSAKRARQFAKNSKASVYYCDEITHKGALFTGQMEVCTDHETRAFLWREGFERYYPKGVDDDDYCVLKFTAQSVNYYHGGRNITISADEL